VQTNLENRKNRRMEKEKIYEVKGDRGFFSSYYCLPWLSNIYDRQ
jgi:hypothetical protein